MALAGDRGTASVLGAAAVAPGGPNTPLAPTGETAAAAAPAGTEHRRRARRKGHGGDAVELLPDGVGRVCPARPEEGPASAERDRVAGKGEKSCSTVRCVYVYVCVRVCVCVFVCMGCAMWTGGRGTPASSTPQLWRRCVCGKKGSTRGRAWHWLQATQTRTQHPWQSERGKASDEGARRARRAVGRAAAFQPAPGGRARVVFLRDKVIKVDVEDVPFKFGGSAKRTQPVHAQSQ